MVLTVLLVALWWCPLSVCGTGCVELRNLELKPEALDFLGLPIVIRRGFIGHIKFHIKSWTTPGMRPSLVMDEVYALAAFKYDWTREEQERRWNLSSEKAAANAKSFIEARLKDAGPQGIFESMGTSIFDNLQVHIRSLHIRFEDTVSNPESPFSFGVTLESLHANVCMHTCSRVGGSLAVLCCADDSGHMWHRQSTDEHWRPTHVDRSKAQPGKSQPPIYKYISLNHLGAYWERTNSIQGCDVDLATCDAEVFSEVFRSMIPRRNEQAARPQHHVLRPVDAEAKLQISRSQRDLSKPQMKLYVCLRCARPVWCRPR